MIESLADADANSSHAMIIEIEIIGTMTVPVRRVRSILIGIVRCKDGARRRRDGIDLVDVLSLADATAGVLAGDGDNGHGRRQIGHDVADGGGMEVCSGGGRCRGRSMSLDAEDIVVAAHDGHDFLVEA